MRGTGVQAVRELIAARFKEVHGDVRDAAGVRASREMAAEIEKPVERPIEVIRKAENAYDEQEERRSRSLRIFVLRRSALRSHPFAPCAAKRRASVLCGGGPHGDRRGVVCASTAPVRGKMSDHCTRPDGSERGWWETAEAAAAFRDTHPAYFGDRVVFCLRCGAFQLF
jgi:hypothetical protein